jgi:hypothetical protein
MVRVACVDISRAEVTHWKGLEQTPIDSLGGDARSTWEEQKILHRCKSDNKMYWQMKDANDNVRVNVHCISTVVSSCSDEWFYWDEIVGCTYVK